MALAATWYVRPANDGNGTTFTYGAQDGTTSATAFPGFAAIAGIAAGDTVCLPGGDEPFFEQLNTGTAGTANAPVTYEGCGATQAVIWSAQGLSGNRSFNSSSAVITTAPYAWETVATDIYKKRIDVRPRMLWEDSTWLQPVDINAASEATILSTLTAGKWGVKDNGDSTYRIYYKSSSSAKSPTTAVIRCNIIPAVTGIVLVDLAWQTFRNIEVRGHTRIAAGTARSLFMADGATHILLDTIRLFRNEEGPSIIPTSVVNDGTELRNVDVLHSSSTGLYVSPGFGLTNFLVSGGNYSNTVGSFYNGTNFTTGDGDGIGIGQSGGTGSDFVIRNITCRSNVNSCITIATSFDMTITNVNMTGISMYDNGMYCYGERADLAQAVGTVILSGFICSGSMGGDSYPSMFFGRDPVSVRTIIIANGLFANNTSITRITFRPHVNNNYRFMNLVFLSNQGGATANRGDLYSNNVNLIGDEVFHSIYFYSTPNQAKRFAGLNAANTGYQYNTSADITAFNAATNATNTVLNVDPLLTTGYKTKAASPLRRAGTDYAECKDVRGRRCWQPPDIGAYQATSGDEANTRTPRQ